MFRILSVFLSSFDRKYLDNLAADVCCNPVTTHAHKMPIMQSSRLLVRSSILRSLISYVVRYMK